MKVTTIYRPIGFATVPKGTYTLIERGTNDWFPRRVDLTEGSTKFGVIEYDRDLTPEELAAFELEVVA